MANEETPAEVEIDSILDSVKDALGLDPDYTEFDSTLVMLINSVFSRLNQLAVGPETGFKIRSSASKWDEYLNGNDLLNEVQAYMFIRVKLLFDPPQMGYLVTAIKEEIQKMEFTINVTAEQARRRSLAGYVSPSGSQVTSVAEPLPVYYVGG